MAGPVVAWSLDDAATACKHEPRIVREHARKADGMARPAPVAVGSAKSTAHPFKLSRVQTPKLANRRGRRSQILLCVLDPALGLAWDVRSLFIYSFKFTFFGGGQGISGFRQYSNARCPVAAAGSRGWYRLTA